MFFIIGEFFINEVLHFLPIQCDDASGSAAQSFRHSEVITVTLRQALVMKFAAQTLLPQRKQLTTFSAEPGNSFVSGFGEKVYRFIVIPSNELPMIVHGAVQIGSWAKSHTIL